MSQGVVAIVMIASYGRGTTGLLDLFSFVHTFRGCGFFQFFVDYHSLAVEV